MRFFGLIDTDYRPTPLLHRLVAADTDQRKTMLLELAQQHYPEEIALSKERGTYGQLATLFRQRRLNGATARKGATFLVHLLTYVGLEVSPYFSQGRTAATTGAGARRKRKTGTGPAVDLVAKPALATARTEPSPEVQKAKYVELLMEMAVKSGDSEKGPSPDLLDRIERMLGHTTSPADKPAAGGEEQTSS